MSNLVTIFGGSGFIGRYIASKMAKQGWRVRVAVRRPNEALFVRTYGDVGQVEPVLANIRDEESVRRAIESADVVINCVGILNEEKNTNIIKANAVKPIKSIKKFDLCFFDPPYDIQDFSDILDKWIKSNLVKKNTLYVYEKHKNTPLKLEKNIDIIEKKQQGISEIIILKKISCSSK